MGKAWRLALRPGTIFLGFLSLLLGINAGVRASELGFGFEPGLPAASPAARAALAAGRSCLRRGDEDGAEARFKARLRRRADPGLLDALGSLYFRQTRLAGADSCYERLSRVSPASALAWYRLGLVRAARGRYRGASDAQRLAVGLAPDFGPAYCALALDLRESGQRGMGAWAVRRALSLMPRYAGAWNLQGAFEQDARHYEAARRSYLKAIALAPGYAGAWFNLAQLWEIRGRRDLALQAYGKAIQAKPAFAEARLARAALYLDAGSPRAARADFEACLALEDWAPDGWRGLRRVDLGQGHRDAAALDLRRAKASERRRARAADRRADRGMEEPSPYEPELPPSPDAGKPLEANP
ncbi:MAG TPA: tetratricopeptide repeat protein [bacterium]|jgi:tetratricopeptide (TPR) repeat protein|nr:tetratricopeptide repeat protein [bacterium]